MPYYDRIQYALNESSDVFYAEIFSAVPTGDEARRTINQAKPGQTIAILLNDGISAADVANVCGQDLAGRLVIFNKRDAKIVYNGDTKDAKGLLSNSKFGEAAIAACLLTGKSTSGWETGSPELVTKVKAILGM